MVVLSSYALLWIRRYDAPCTDNAKVYSTILYCTICIQYRSTEYTLYYRMRNAYDTILYT